jgi:preprotein translocase subunit SecA
LAAAGKDFVRIQGDQAVWKNSWDAAGTPVNWDMVHMMFSLSEGYSSQW